MPVTYADIEAHSDPTRSDAQVAEDLRAVSTVVTGQELGTAGHLVGIVPAEHLNDAIKTLKYAKQDTAFPLNEVVGLYADRILGEPEPQFWPDWGNAELRAIITLFAHKNVGGVDGYELTPEGADAILEIATRRPFAGTTEADVAAARRVREGELRQIAKQAVRDAITAAIDPVFNDPSKTADDLWDTVLAIIPPGE
ncbi:MAG: hypothetical protein AAF532_02275 [Planctomycetota bacterium]